MTILGLLINLNFLFVLLIIIPFVLAYSRRSKEEKNDQEKFQLKPHIKSFKWQIVTFGLGMSTKLFSSFFAQENQYLLLTAGSSLTTFSLAWIAFKSWSLFFVKNPLHER